LQRPLRTTWLCFAFRGRLTRTGSTHGGIFASSIRSNLPPRRGQGTPSRSQ
jgi:hypothetical protein